MEAESESFSVINYCPAGASEQGISSLTAPVDDHELSKDLKRNTFLYSLKWLAAK